MDPQAPLSGGGAVEEQVPRYMRRFREQSFNHVRERSNSPVFHTVV